MKIMSTEIKKPKKKEQPCILPGMREKRRRKKKRNDYRR
jgi:hypothetical protein